jgi:hypothetical protein
MMFNNKVVTFENLEKMKKTYFKPETKWLEPFGNEALMQETSLDVNDDADDNNENQVVDNPDDLLSKPSYSVWDDNSVWDNN